MDPLTVGFGLAFAALKSRGDSDKAIVAVFGDLAGHLTGHLAHADIDPKPESCTN